MKIGSGVETVSDSFFGARLAEGGAVTRGKAGGAWLEGRKRAAGLVRDHAGERFVQLNFLRGMEGVVKHEIDRVP